MEGMEKNPKPILKIRDSFVHLTENKCFYIPNHQDVKFWHCNKTLS